MGVAVFNGWTVGVFAATSLLLGIFSLTGLLMGVGLAVVSYNEFAGAKMLRRLDQCAARRLGFNQLGLCGLLVVYSLWSIYSTLAGPSQLDAALAAAGQAEALLGSIERLQTVVTLAVYGGVIVGSIVFQGGMSWYYFTRARHIRAYVAETPGWIVDLERASGPP